MEIHSRTILVVEDNRNWRELLKLLFQSDYRIEDASNVEEATAKLKKHRFDLLITNLHLDEFADQQGLTVVEKIQQDTPGTPCIILTGSDEESRREVQNFCQIHYGSYVSVMGKGGQDLYSHLRNNVKKALGNIEA